MFCGIRSLSRMCFLAEAPDDYDGACDDIVDTAGMSAEELCFMYLKEYWVLVC